MIIRFRSNFVGWVALLLVMAAILLVLLWLLVRHLAPMWVTLSPWAIWIYVLADTLPQYCEIRPEGLFIRQGFRMNLLSYDSLLQIEYRIEPAHSSGWGVPANTIGPPLNPVLVVTRQSRHFFIAPVDQDRFLDEVARRSPQLVRRELRGREHFSWYANVFS